MDEAGTLDTEIKGVTAAKVTDVKKKVESALGDWKKDADHIKFVKAHLAETQALTTKTEMDNRVVLHLTTIQTKFDAFNTAVKAALKGWLTANGKKRLARIQGLKADARALYSAIYDAYRAHIHEEDAWATGGAAGTRFPTERTTRLAAEKAAAAKKKARRRRRRRPRRRRRRRQQRRRRRRRPRRRRHRPRR